MRRLLAAARRRQADRSSSASELLTGTKKGVPIGTPFAVGRSEAYFFFAGSALAGAPSG